VDARGRLTYGELQKRADQCALGLLVLGVRHGDVVTAQLPNWNEFAVLTQSPSGKLQALPADGRAVAGRSNRDQAFLEVARGVRDVVNQLHARV
jgi:non-ribosomal peptide synthetase component E (peptide arylation enzyme)